MSSIDLYMSMGFAREWAERAPTNPDAGIPWLLRATTINTMPQRFVREGHFDYTFYKSRVEFIDTEYIVDDYDSRIILGYIRDHLATYTTFKNQFFKNFEAFFLVFIKVW